MDTSETYIKMCEKAEEIQNEWYQHTSDTRDFIWCPTHRKLWAVLQQGYLCEKNKPCTTKGIWLPRQDQLQEMVHFTCSKGDVQRLLRYFIERSPDVQSMEQLWLAFVMKEKYNKTWKGTDWVSDLGSRLYCFRKERD